MAAEYTVIDRHAPRIGARVNARRGRWSKLPGPLLKETAAVDD